MAENQPSPKPSSPPLPDEVGNYQVEKHYGQRSSHQVFSGSSGGVFAVSLIVNGRRSSLSASMGRRSMTDNSSSLTSSTAKGSKFRSYTSTNGADGTTYFSSGFSHGHQHHHDNHHHHCHHCCHGDEGYYVSCDQGHIHHIQSKKDDVFEHPDWQFLKEYREDGTTKKDKQPIKPSKNKNSRPNFDKSKVDKNRYNKTPEKVATDQHSTSSSNLRTTTAMLSDLALEEGLVVKDVCPDGNCMFAAVVDQLRVRGEFRYTARTLRQAAVEYLRNNPNQEDGTPLLEFLTDFDGTWSDYLARMGREGEWGDQMMLGAIANVLNRRLVVLSGRSALHKTCMDPVVRIGGEKHHLEKMATDNEQEVDMADTGSNIRDDVKGANAPPQVEELYLGHVAEAHYVSLRRVDWRDGLLQILRSRGPDSHGENTENLDSNDETRSLQTEMPHQVLPMQYLNFLLFFMDRSEMIRRYVLGKQNDKGKYLSPFSTFESVGGIWNRIDVFFLKQNNKEAVTDMLGDIVPESIHIVNDSKVRFSRNTCSKKDLVSNSTSCEIGYTRLQPLFPHNWRPALCSTENQLCLKQLHTITESHLPIGFRSDWPECAREWTTRERPSGWPNKDAKDEIVQKGVYVVPGSHARSKCPEVEWMYTFHEAEKILGKPVNMKMSAKKWFAVAKALLMLCFQEKALLTGNDFLPLLLYTCEELTMTEISTNPAKFIMHLLALLKQWLQQKFIPHYFMSGMNLIEMLSEKDILWHVEIVDSIQNHIMENMYQVLDHHGLDMDHGLGKIYDGIISAQQMGKGKDKVNIKESFHSLYMIEIQEHIKAGDYYTAVDVAKKSHLEESDSSEMTADNVANIAYNVLSGLPILEQWLFSFYVDLIEATSVMSIVCKGRECISLESVFGEQFIEVLQIDTENRLTRENLKAPLQAVQNENLVVFVKHVVKTLKCCAKYDDAMVAGAHHFLKSNTSEILKSISNEEKDFGRHTGHTKMLRDLSGLFGDVYYMYKNNDHIGDFKDLMPLYDEFSKIFNDYQTYCFLEQLWDLFGNKEKAEEAYMMAGSFESGWQTY